jgi:hypothetical protein
LEDSLSRVYLIQTAFWQLDPFPSSGEKGEGFCSVAPIRRSLCHCTSDLLRADLKIFRPLHIMTDTDPVSETFCISNVSQMLKNSKKCLVPKQIRLVCILVGSSGKGGEFIACDIEYWIQKYGPPTWGQSSPSSSLTPIYIRVF